MKRHWIAVDESHERAGYCCMSVREELSHRLICDLADEPLEYPQCVERSRLEAQLIAAAPEMLHVLRRLVCACESIDEQKYNDAIAEANGLIERLEKIS